MTAIVDENTCIACGLCVSACNEVYDFGDDGKAHAVTDPVPAEYEETAREAAENCPVDAISITD